MYAKLVSTTILGKTLGKLNVSVVNYALGTSRPTLGYSIEATDGSTLTQGTVQLDKETYDQWTTNDEILLEYVAGQLGVQIDEIPTDPLTSADYLRDNPDLETR